ncbi:MAG: TonB-dependent receptor [Bacteroidales bacterium]|nr:TonB-dependent receptor [Bacteroidales bacterium]
MKKTLFILLLSLIVIASQAQALIDVKGVVKDAVSGEELIGVNILVEGTHAGTVTGINGDFSISTPQNGTIRISYIGYKSQEIRLTGENFLTIKLEPDAQIIDEVVVVGYSVQKKRDVLGSVSKVDGTDISKIPVASTQQALQGRVAGVNVSTQTGAPGAPVSVRIRGVNSMSLSNEPLYIVDGIPVEGALNNISPNEIESMSILKDASSAAIYGSRATNGVVLITTKSGKSGDSKISYNTQLGFQQHGRLTKMASTDQYISLYNEAATADNATSVVQRALIENAWVKDFPNVNHLEEIFRTAPFQSHELSISGGTEKTQYLVAGTIYKQDGIINNTNYNRTSLRSNINSQVKKWLKVGLNVSGGISNNRLVSSSGDGYAGEGGSVVRYALYRNPAIPVRNSLGEFIDLPSEYYGNSVYNSFFGDGYNPVGLTENTDRTKKIKSLLTTGNVLISLPANLMLKTTAGLDYNNTELREYNKTWGTANRINGTNGLSASIVNTVNWSVNSTLSHNIVFAENHNLNSMIGAEAIKNSGSGMYGSESEFLNTDPDFLFLGLGSSKTNISQSVWESTLVSFFANVNYNFNQKYYLSGILRRDGSSRFSTRNKWGTFYSVSGGWNMETEDFMQNVKAINKLKLRAGYGSIGNQNIPLYAYADRYGYNYYYTFGGNSYNGFAQTQLGNTELKWETSNQFNLGADFEFLKGSLGITLDYYYKVTHDMLLPASLPPSIGNASPPQINSTGNVLNTGIDLEFFYRKNYRDGGFNIALNSGFLHNEVFNLDVPYFAGRIDTGVYATRTENGHSIGSFYLYEMDGIFQNDVEVLTSAYQGNNIKPGDVKYVDQNGDNVIDAKDRTFLGSAIPTFNTGLNLSGNYKNFDLSLFFQGAFGQKIFSQVNFDIEGYYRGFNVTERYYKEHWTGEGTSNTQPRASWTAKSNNVKASSRFLEDGSYMRLKNLQLGYTVPNTKKLKIENLRFYIAGTNLFTLTGYSGLDPEMTVSTNSASEGDMANGIDWGTYPVAMNLTFGMNLTF